MAKAELPKERLHDIFVDESRSVCPEHNTQFTCGGFENFPGILCIF